jgi:catechol 2,3-dioxygenase-like lactoylglutathione lyase family enzyme
VNPSPAADTRRCAPQIAGILETALIVEDTTRAADFYVRVLGLREMFHADRLSALDAGPGQTLLLFKRGGSLHDQETAGGAIPGGIDASGRSHMAFRIAAAELEPWRQWLEQNGIAIISTVRWEQGGRSIYFRDPDGNLLELGTPGLWENY